MVLDQLEHGGVSGLDPTGRRWTTRAGPIGGAVLLARGRKGEGRRLALEAPGPHWTAPPCPVFNVCGGCQLQEMDLDTQRTAKAALVSRQVGFPSHPPDGAPLGYGYRNKLELSFGGWRYVTDQEKASGQTATPGSFLGFHPPGWFARIVPVERCALATPTMNAVLAAVWADLPGPAWDNQTHGGQWRHVLLREGTDGVLVALITTSDTPEDAVRAVGDRIAAVAGVTGVIWVVRDLPSEVAQGELRAVLHGAPELSIRLGGVDLGLPWDAFFQVNTGGADVLLGRIREALYGDEAPSGTLLDLYCGVGALGLALAPKGGQVIGVELNPSAIPVARENAARLGVSGAWHVGAVEAVLPTLRWEAPARIVVDPPRAGLHPDAARFLAAQQADVLVYVACNPASLGRDRAVLEAGGWRMTDLWTVDLFPQTRHVEAVGRFTRA